MSEIAISVENLSKQYRRGDSQLSDSLRDAVASTCRQLFRRRVQRAHQKQQFWALRSITLDVLRGEVVGIIGRNGAGKSTLLKILSRITPPTSGCAIINGRLGSLLEVGTGFHPELTGRENIFLNGAILGMRKADIVSKLDEIIDWSGVSAFVDMPVKRYSSGMRVRLAFAVAAHMEPEILIVDEVLAVGDAEFQSKCLGKMNEVARSGRTVLFVSHNMNTVLNLCGRGVVLDRGEVLYDGEASSAVRTYIDSVRPPGAGFVSLEEARGRDTTRGSIIRGVGIRRHGTDEYLDRVHTGDDLTIDIEYDCGSETIDVAQLTISTPTGQPLLTLGTHLTHSAPKRLTGRGVLACEVRHLPLNVGEYDLSVIMTNRVPWNDVDRAEAALRFEVEPNDYFGTGLRPGSEQGPVAHRSRWSAAPARADAPREFEEPVALAQ